MNCDIDYQNIEKNIVFISDDQNDGCGVCVGDLLITAGHVIEPMDHISITIDGKSFKFTKKDAICYLYKTECVTVNDYDLCIFKVPGIHSPLRLYDGYFPIEQTLTSISKKHCVNVKSAATKEDVELFDLFNMKPTIETVEVRYSKATIKQYQGNYCTCNMSVCLERGRSGSPILHGLDVCGILSRGNGDVGDECCYVTSKSIIDILKTK